jgi:hypothetical protein
MTDNAHVVTKPLSIDFIRDDRVRPLSPDGFAAILAVRSHETIAYYNVVEYRDPETLETLAYQNWDDQSYWQPVNPWQYLFPEADDVPPFAGRVNGLQAWLLGESSLEVVGAGAHGNGRER